MSTKSIKKKKNVKDVPVKDKEHKNLYSRPFLILIIMSIITSLIYASSVFNDIVFLDDDIMFENLKMLKQTSYYIFKEAITRDAMVSIGGDLYRPVQTFILLFLYQLGGGAVIYFHVFQILLHIGCCFLIFILFSEMGCDRKILLILTLIYAVHPLFTSLVCFIPAIGDQLLFSFALFSFFFFIKYLKNAKSIYLLLHIIFFFFSAFTKETALVLPAIFILYLFLFQKDKLNIRVLIVLFFWIFIPVLYMVLRQKYVLPEQVASHNELNSTNITTNIIYNLPSFFEYITKFFVPYQLSFLAPYSKTRTLTGIVIIAFFIVLVLLRKLRIRHFIFGLLWYSIFIMPPMLYRNPVFDYGEHRGFLPLLGFVFILASVEFKVKTKYYWALIFLIPILGLFSFQRKNEFKDPVAFYTGIIANDPVPIAYLNRGSYVHRFKNDINMVFDDYTKAIALKNDYSTAYYNRAILKSEIFKDYKSAFDDLEAAIKYKSNYADAYYHRGYMKLTINNDIEGALDDINKAIVLNPKYVLAYNNRGVLKQNYLNDIVGAIDDFSKSISIQPINNPSPYFHRGVHYYNTGKHAEACADWESALKQGHQQAQTYLNNHCK